MASERNSVHLVFNAQALHQNQSQSMWNVYASLRVQLNCDKHRVDLGLRCASDNEIVHGLWQKHDINHGHSVACDANEIKSPKSLQTHFP